MREYVEKISFLDSIEDNFFIIKNFLLDMDFYAFLIPKVLFKILRKSLFQSSLKSRIILMR